MKQFLFILTALLSSQSLWANDDAQELKAFKANVVRALNAVNKLEGESYEKMVIENAQKIVQKLMTLGRELKYYDTICKPTKLYQAEIRTMPKENDVMIIVGSFTSANTKRLTEISKSLNSRSYQVECGNDIQEEWLEDAEAIGVTAGASTPDWIIDKVVERLKSFE